MVDYRPRDQMREIRYKQEVMNEILLVYVASVRIYQKSNLGKGKKRDPERQHNVQYGDLPDV